MAIDPWGVVQHVPTVDVPEEVVVSKAVVPRLEVSSVTTVVPGSVVARRTVSKTVSRINSIVV